MASDLRLHAQRVRAGLERWWQQQTQPADGWPELKPLYRRKLKKGHAGQTTRLTGYQYRWRGRNVVPRRIVAVIRPDGTLVDSSEYSLGGVIGVGKNGSYYDSRVLKWRAPTMTAGLTVLFEAV